MKLIMARVTFGSQPPPGDPQGLRIQASVAGQTAKGALGQQVSEQVAQTGTRSEAKLFLEF
jgi:hypothetical protein